MAIEVHDELKLLTDPSGSAGRLHYDAMGCAHQEADGRGPHIVLDFEPGHEM
jgi:hypothetical protein